jgi:universal stress protein A
MENARIRRILVATDFSDVAGGALQTAVGMARAFDAGIELLHVSALIALLPPPAEVLPFATIIPDHSRRIQESLSDEAKLVREAGVPCDTRTMEGAPHTEIIRRAQEMGADLIVMGTHGHGGLAHAVLGSVVERVLHRARCPVLVVPARKS